MLRTQTIAFFLAAVVVSALATTQAHASQRTFVSAAIGSDANATIGCTAVAPCRLFSTAMVKTDVGGEVIVVDSGSYDPVTITKSISLIAPKGVYAGISVPPNKDGIKIATPGIAVVLRGLTIIGQGGNVGIALEEGLNNRLTIEGCAISNMKATGIFVNNAETIIIDTVVRNNTSDGVRLENGTRATITRTIVSQNFFGVDVVSNISGRTTTADIVDSVLDRNSDRSVMAQSSTFNNTIVKVSVRDSRIVNSGKGLLAVNSGGIGGGLGTVSLSASNNLLSNNGVGIMGLNTAKILASGNTVSNNNIGLLSFPGVIFESAGNNTVRNNDTDLSGPITVIGTR
jgi:hypothetical protein